MKTLISYYKLKLFGYTIAILVLGVITLILSVFIYFEKIWINQLPMREIVVYIVGITGLILIFIGAYISGRRSSEIKNSIELKKKLRDLKEDDFSEYERIRKLREEKSKVEFMHNLNQIFVLEHLRLKKVDFFRSCEWEFRPGVNLLLGRNGYGKSYILRTIAALLQRDDEKSKDLLVTSESILELNILRNGKKKVIRREYDLYTESVGKIPILAIPDSRFLDRSKIEIGPSGESYNKMPERGAYHFLYQIPYSGMINTLLYEFCIDYYEHGRNFNLPIFKFLEEVVWRLSGDRFKFYSIKRVGREKFEIKVLTEGNETPLSIQRASQGTLSILSLFGLIRSFLKSVFGEMDKLNLQPAVVIIDEADAHLHPTWTQKLTELFREFFPRIQFIMSAHNPVMVAGCLEREVAVLRLKDKKFYIQQIDRDFVGTSAQELYMDLFNIDEIDDSLRRHPSWKAMDDKTLAQFRRLDKKADEGTLESIEYLDRERMIRQDRLFRKISTAIDERKDEKMRILQLEAEIERLKTKIHAQGKYQNNSNEEVQL